MPWRGSKKQARLIHFLKNYMLIPNSGGYYIDDPAQKCSQCVSRSVRGSSGLIKVNLVDHINYFFCAMYYVFPNAFERVLIRFWTGFERVRTRTLFLRKWVWTGFTLVYAMCYVKWSFFLTRTCGKIPQTWNWSQILPNMVKTLQKWKGPLRNPPKHVKCKKKT